MRSLEGEFQNVVLSGVGRSEASLVMYGLQQHKVTEEEEVQIEMDRPRVVEEDELDVANELRALICTRQQINRWRQRAKGE